METAGTGKAMTNQGASNQAQPQSNVQLPGSSHNIQGVLRGLGAPHPATTSLNPALLPKWSREEIDQKLAESNRLLQEWKEHMDKTDRLKTEDISQSDIQKHVTLKRKLHDNLGIMARIVQYQVKLRKLPEGVVPVPGIPLPQGIPQGPGMNPMQGAGPPQQMQGGQVGVNNGRYPGNYNLYPGPPHPMQNMPNMQMNPRPPMFMSNGQAVPAPSGGYAMNQQSHGQQQNPPAYYNSNNNPNFQSGFPRPNQPNQGPRPMPVGMNSAPYPPPQGMNMAQYIQQQPNNQPGQAPQQSAPNYAHYNPQQMPTMQNSGNVGGGNTLGGVSDQQRAQYQQYMQHQQTGPRPSGSQSQADSNNLNFYPNSSMFSNVPPQYAQYYANNTAKNAQPGEQGGQIKPNPQLSGGNPPGYYPGHATSYTSHLPLGYSSTPQAPMQGMQGMQGHSQYNAGNPNAYKDMPQGQYGNPPRPGVSPSLNPSSNQPTGISLSSGRPQQSQPASAPQQTLKQVTLAPPSAPSSS